jgi:hypothetical protein
VIRLKYDPHVELNPGSWLALDESERIDSVIRYHWRQGIRLPDNTVHALIHVIVENQVALGDEYPVKSVLARLMAEGLDRHDAVHAIGSVLTGQVFDAVKQKSSGTDLNAQYLEDLNRLTATNWRKQWS